MKFIRELTGSEKVLLLIIIILVGLVLTRNPIQAANEGSVDQYSDKELYELFYYSIGEENPAVTLMYLFAYIQRNPVEFANDLNGDTAELIDAFNSLLATVQANYSYLKIVNDHLTDCKKYPCGDEQASVSATEIERVPPNMVKVCEGYNQEEPCFSLPAGEYTQWQQLGVANDSISSIWVGADVEITLCVHSLGHTDECLTFEDLGFGLVDNDLRDNIIPGHGYSIDNNVSTARIVYRPFPGLTPP